MISYRKIGGLHWISIGRFRLAFCVVKPKPTLPHIADTPNAAYWSHRDTEASIDYHFFH